MLLLWIKFAKLLAVMLYLAGSVGTAAARAHDDRQRFAYALAGPGFGLTWLLGFVLAGVMGVSYSASWILGALGLSFVSLQATLYVAGQDGRRTAASAAMILAPLVVCVWLMVFKPG